MQDERGRGRINKKTQSPQACDLMSVISLLLCYLISVPNLYFQEGYIENGGLFAEELTDKKTSRLIQ